MRFTLHLGAENVSGALSSNTASYAEIIKQLIKVIWEGLVSREQLEGEPGIESCLAAAWGGERAGTQGELGRDEP